MKPPEQSKAELHALLTALIDGELTGEQSTALAERLRDDAAARAEYIRLMSLHARLHARHGGLTFEPVVGMLSSSAGVARARGTVLTVRRLSDFFARPTPLSLALATLFVIGLLSFMAFVAPPIYHATSQWRVTPAPMPPTTIAEISKGYNARWADPGNYQRGTRLQRGESLVLLTGFAEITFDDQSSVLLQGPVRLTVDQVERGERKCGLIALEQGKLTARVPPSATGFTIETALVEAIDVGTEFGVAADPDATDVVVFQGQVSARPTTTAAVAKLLSISGGEAFRFERERPLGRRIPRAARRFVRLPAIKPPIETDRYAQAVLADRPAAYWRLNDDTELAVDQTGGGGGVYLNGAARGAPRLGAADKSRTARFDGVDDYLLLDYDAALNGRDFTIETWVWLDAKPRDFASVITSRSEAGGAAGYVLYVAPTGEWQLWTGNNTQWAMLVGPVASVGSWTHVVATYQHIRTQDDGMSSGVACLYIDGQFVAEKAAMLYRPQRNPRLPMRIGAGATEADPPRYFFPGCISDVAIYSKALGIQEIKRHFAAAAQPPDSASNEAARAP